MNTPNCPYWAVIPAAGVGRRMQADRPKQYLTLGTATVIEHSLGIFLNDDEALAVVVAVAEDDPYWPELQLSHPKLRRVSGGAERYLSVYAALQSLAGEAQADDWVLVHDAARPCLSREDLAQLKQQLQPHPVGGVLGVPVADTVKQTDAEQQVVATVPRAALWRAFTPQMFRYAALCQALQLCIEQQQAVTDDASAMEFMGLQPQMVAGRSDNIKITHPQDLPYAAWVLQQQEN